MSVLSTFSIKLASAITSFVLLILSTQFLGASGRGSITLIVTNIGLVTLANGFVGGASLMYLLSKNNGREYTFKMLGIAYLWTPISSLIIATVTLYGGAIDTRFMCDAFLLGWLAALVAVNALVVLSAGNIALYNGVNLIQTGVCLTFFYLASLTDAGATVKDYINGLYIAYVLSLLVSTVVSWNYLKGLRKTDSSSSLIDSIAEIFKIGAASQIGNLFLYLTYRLSYYLLSTTSGLNDVGIYSVGVMISESLWLVSGSFAIVLYAKTVKSNQDALLTNLTIKYAKFCFATSIVFVATLMCLPIAFFTSAFGVQFVSVKLSLALLSIAMVSTSVSTVINHYLAGVGKFRTNAIVSGFGFLVSFFGNLILIPSYGFAGAAIVSSLSGLLVAVLFITQFVRITKCNARDLIPSVADLVLIRKEITSLCKTLRK